MTPVQQPGTPLPSPLGLHEEEMPLLQVAREVGKKSSHKPQQLSKELFIYTMSYRQACKASSLVVLPKLVVGAEATLRVGSCPGTAAMLLPGSDGGHQRHARVAPCLFSLRWIHFHGFFRISWWIHLHGLLPGGWQMDMPVSLVVGRTIGGPWSHTILCPNDKPGPRVGRCWLQSHALRSAAHTDAGHRRLARIVIRCPGLLRLILGPRTAP